MSGGGTEAGAAVSRPEAREQAEHRPDTAAILVEGVGKRYSRFSFRWGSRLGRFPPALQDVSFQLDVGETLGLLGPNGAGKTTLLKIMATLIYPSEGRVLVYGRDVAKDSLWVRAQLGLVSCDDRSFYWRLTGRHNLDFFGTLYGVDRDVLRERMEALLDTLGLTFASDRPYQGYSAGMKQKLAIARGLLSDPRIVFYDEPTRSLDPVSVHSIRTWIHEKKARSPEQSQVIATNQLSEAEELCDRVLILNRGRIIAMGTPEEIRERFHADDSVVHHIRVRSVGPEALDGIGKDTDGGILDIRQRYEGGGVWELTTRTVRDGPGLSRILETLVSSGALVMRCRVQEVSFDEVFRSLVLGEDRTG